MSDQKIKESIKQIKHGESYIEGLEGQLKQAKAAHQDNKANLANYFHENMYEKVSIEGETVSAFYDSKYTIMGGNKPSEQRTHVIESLLEIGLIDEAKILVFKSYNGNALNSALKKLAKEFPDKYKDLVEGKFISVYNHADVKFKKES